ncbi:MAG: ABC transporter permease [Chitinophagaceae bacterium]
MLRNFFKTTLRSFLKNKTYSILNIAGLAIGIACAALIFLWVEDEVNYNDMHINKDNLYAVRVNEAYSAGTVTHWSTPALAGPSIQNDIPGIKSACRKSEGTASMLFTVNNKPMYAGGCYAEASLFSMFTLPFVQGNAHTPFSQLHSLVITEKAAVKFFGAAANVIGKIVRMDNKQDYVISGVVKDIPENSSLQFEWVAPFDVFYDENKDWLSSWKNYSITTYVQLNPGTSAITVDAQLYGYTQKHDNASISHLFLFGMNDWRLYNQFENGVKTGGGRIAYVRMFSIIAWIILCIACINFMNLATARSEKRAREVGVHKVLGARKQSLVFRFIGEALFMSALATAVALTLVAIALPAFNQLVQKTLSLKLGSLSHVLFLLSIVLVCGLVAGSYPSFYLSSFNPIAVLKGLKVKAGGAALVRKGLVVLQFTISVTLIIATIVIYRQIQHVKDRQLGFAKSNLIEIPVRGDMKKNFAVIKQDLLNTGIVENAALSDHETIYNGNNTGGLRWEGKASKDETLISYRSVTPEFMATSGISVLDGRGFVDSDSVPVNGKINVVITESFARLIGKGSAVGKQLWMDGDTSKQTIVGVVNDYVYGNMYEKPDPVIFICMQPQYTATVMYVRVKPHTDAEQALAKLGGVMQKNNPAFPFEYEFVDDQFNNMFKTEMLISSLSQVFAILAIVISCLGLFGLAAYMAELRTKEIGIRKVLGASVSGITALLSKDFLKLVSIACIIAFPLSWWIMHNWLQGYTYRISIGWVVFAVAGIMAILIALVTVSFQAFKAAIANPSKSLRSE